MNNYFLSRKQREWMRQAPQLWRTSECLKKNGIPVMIHMEDGKYAWLEVRRWPIIHIRLGDRVDDQGFVDHELWIWNPINVHMDRPDKVIKGLYDWEELIKEIKIQSYVPEPEDYTGIPGSWEFQMGFFQEYLGYELIPMAAIAPGRYHIDRSETRKIYVNSVDHTAYLKHLKVREKTERMQEEKSEGPQCTLSDQELIKECQKQISKISATYGKAWQMSIPPDMNRDSDMLFSELVDRFKSLVGGESRKK